MDFFLNKAKSWRPSRHTHTKQTEIDKQQMVACFGSQFLRIISLAIIFRNFQKFLSKKDINLRTLNNSASELSTTYQQRDLY